MYGYETMHKIATRAERSVKSRQDVFALMRRDSVLVGNHAIATPDTCRQMDSLWYVTLKRESGRM